MARSRKFKPGMLVRGVELVRPVHFKRHHFWEVIDPITGERGLVRIDRFNLKEFRMPRASALYKIWQRYKVRAIGMGLKWEISLPSLYSMVRQNCHYCSARPNGGKEPLLYNGLDRKNNKIGYTKLNVVPCCAKCNAIKSNLLTYKEMMVAIRAIKKLARD